MKLRLIFILICMCFQLSLLGHDVDTDREKGPYFSGIITGGKPGKDSLRIFFKNDLLPPGSQNRILFYVKINDEGSFYFRLPRINDIGKMEIFLTESHTGVNNILAGQMDMYFSSYYVENTDSIFFNISIDRNGIVRHNISGRGMDKYLAQKSIAKTSNFFIEESFEKETLVNKDSLKTRLARKIASTELTLTLRMMILNHYKDRLNPNIFKLIQADISGVTIRSLFFESDFFVEGDSFLSYFSPIDVEGDKLALSDDYVDYLVRRIIFEFQIKRKRLKYTIADIYPIIKTNYQGVLRDKLISTYLCDSFRRVYEEQVSDNAYDLCLIDAINTIEHPELKKMVKRRMNKYGKGATAYNFKLLDSAGRVIQLKNFNGKVVLIDIYATVCSGCRLFAKTLKEKVIPEFNNNDDVVFIAVSAEENRNVWLQDLKEGHNANKEDEVCLFTDGKGIEHPYLRYYEIGSFPTLLLIDKNGRIFNSSQNTLKANTPGEIVVQMIREALEEQN